MTYDTKQAIDGINTKTLSPQKGYASSEHKSLDDKKWPRYFLSGTIAAGLTFALGVSMALMIKTNFTPADKPEVQAFEINPVAEDIAPPTRKKRIEKLKKVEVPPPTPRIEIAQKTKPSEPIVAVGGAKDLDWKKPKLTRGDWSVIAVSQNEAPLHRVEPVMPRQAERSGHCVMQFNVSAEGAPYEIAVQSCSQSIFTRPSIKAVEKWKYRPKTTQGQRVARTGLTTRLSFNLTDERGKIIPE